MKSEPELVGHGNQGGETRGFPTVARWRLRYMEVLTAATQRELAMVSKASSTGVSSRL
jgi:hypothetical protein